MSGAEPDIRVLIVDDQRVVREGLTMLVGLIDGITVAGSAASGTEALVTFAELRPDVVLMDLRMPDMDGVTATRELLQRQPAAAVLVLTTYADDESLFPALQAGARGYLTKAAGAEEIGKAIRAVRRGETHLDPAVQRRLVVAVSGTFPASPAGHGIGPDGLTQREVEVLALIAAGLSNGEIGSKLFLSRATVKSHVNHIFSKIRARDRAQAVAYAYRHGLVAPGGGALPGA